MSLLGLLKDREKESVAYQDRTSTWMANRLLRHPLIATLVTLMLLVTGGLGSVASSDIRNAFPFYWGAGVWSWWATIFWAMAIFSGVLYFFRQQAIDRARGDAENRLTERAEKLETLIRTMPPENFMEEFVRLYATVEISVESALGQSGESKAEAVRLGILHLLRVIAYLAKKFDGDGTSGRYAANLMFFRPSDQLTDDQVTDCSQFLKFGGQSTDLRKLSGVLDLDPRFSTTHTEELEPDDKVQRIVLPVPQASKNSKQKWLVLPGAPMAWVTGKASAFSDTKNKLREWLDNECDFPDWLKTDVETYFKSHEQVASFVSVPLLPAERLRDSSNTTPVSRGVVNIHVDHPGLLRGADWTNANMSSLSHFTKVIQPILLKLLNLLAADSD